MPRLFPLAFPFLFAGIWAGILYLLSRLSGWRALAGRYRTEAAPSGERMRWTSGQLGGVSFRSCLNLTLDPAGLHLVPLLPFRPFMPPLLVPWADIRFEGFTRVFFLEFACFRLGDGGPVFAVYRGTGERLIPRLRDDERAAFASRSAFAGSLFSRKIALIAAVGAAAGIVAALLAARR